jgi:predicted kinase
MDPTDIPSQPWTFPFCPEPPGWSLDWPGIVATFPWIAAMRDCPQDPEHHAEGDVLTHVRMVCEALVGMEARRGLGPEERSVVFAAALLHDVAKPACTRLEDGRLRSPKHAVRGAQMTRLILWRDLAPGEPREFFHIRESIVGLVRHHFLPFHVLEATDPRRRIVEASQTVRCDWLAILAEADSRGRKCMDKANILDRVTIFRDFAEEQGCMAGPRQFPSDHSRFVYFHEKSADPDRLVYDDTKLEVVLMSGLPAAGKDTWVRDNLPSLPMVSLDQIRRQLKIAPDDDQGAVINMAREHAREHLRHQQAFVWNATNTSRTLRSQVIQLLDDYHAQVRIVYVETAWEELLRRNRSRENPVPQDVIERLTERLEVPDLTEAHRVE